MTATTSPSSPGTPRVVAIVLNFGGPGITIESVSSLLAMEHPALDVVVVDNGSTDDSIARVEAAFPGLLQLRIAHNQGISPGINLGLRHALEGGYDYALVLNNDIEAAPDMLREMLAVAERDPAIGCVGPKTYYHGDPQRLWSAGGMLRFKESVTRERGDGELDQGQYDRDQPVDYVNGCAMLMRRAAIEATGLWHPVYFLGVEDADWCMRMKRQGFTCWYAHRARLWHKVSASVGVYKPGRTFHTGRSTAIFVRKFARPWQWLSFLVFYAASIPVALVRELAKGNARAVTEKLRGVREGLRVPIGTPPAP